VSANQCGVCTAILCAICLCAGPSSRLAAQERSVEEIVARCADAMGLGPQAQRLQTLRFLLRKPDTTSNTTWEIRRPDGLRKSRHGAWTLVFDGRRAAYLEGPRREDGTLDGPHLVPEEDWHDFLLDIALFVPAFFDYPAELLGMDTVAGTPAYILRVALPMGEEARYSIDGKTFLPLKVTLPSWGYDRFFGGWEEADGVRYFRSVWTQSDQADLTQVDVLGIDEEIPAERFSLPAGIRR
jgi:hypothetical protein